MGLVEANVSFDHGGRQIKQGDVVDTTNYLYTLFPTRFTAVAAGGTVTVIGTAGTTAGTLGSLIGKYSIANAAGTVIGWSAYYENIT